MVKIINETNSLIKNIKLKLFKNNFIFTARVMLKSGKTLWMCQQHINETEAVVLEDVSIDDSNQSNLNEQIASMMLNDIEKINTEI